MCVHFSTLIIWELNFKVQTSFEAQNFVLLLSLSLHSSSPTFKLLSMASYGGALLLDSFSPSSGVSNHLPSFSIQLPLIFKNQRTPLIKKIQGLQALHGATLCGIRASSSRWCSFDSSIFLFGQFTLIPWNWFCGAKFWSQNFTNYD